MIKLVLFLAIALIPMYSLADIEKFEATPVDMFVGETLVLHEENVKRIAVGAGDLVDFQELDYDRILIMGNKVGSTTVHIWYKEDVLVPRVYNVRIVENDPTTRVRSEKMIRFNVKLIEFRKSALQDLGIDWSKSIDGPSGAVAARIINSNLVSAPLADTFGVLPNRLDGIQGSLGLASTITSRINFLASNGSASTIAEPILMCLNGGEAEFHAGGEVPLPVRGEDGDVSVEFKPYGIRLSVKPIVNDAGMIDAVISTEVSEIDPSVSVENIPGFITRNTTTRVQVNHGETIVLAGLLSDRKNSDSSSIPGLVDVPGVGNAFKNTLGQNQTVELVMFLQPEVVGMDETQTPSPQDASLISDEDQLAVWRSKLNLNLVD